MDSLRFWAAITLYTQTKPAKCTPSRLTAAIPDWSPWTTFLADDPHGLYMVPGDSQPKPLLLPGAPTGFTLLSPRSHQWQDPEHLANRMRMNVRIRTRGPVLCSFERPPGAGLNVWSPDGRAIDYSITRGGVADPRRQPLAGGAPKQLTPVRLDLQLCVVH